MSLACWRVAPRALVAVLGLLPVACSTVPRIEALIVDDVPVSVQDATLSVQVALGTAVNVGLWVDFPSAVFADAVEKSLRGSTSEASPATGGDRRLEITIHDLSMTEWGVSVVMISVWSTSDAPGWQHTAVGTGSASFGEAIWGYTRVRLATERAGRAMIRDGLEALRQRAATSHDR